MQSKINITVNGSKYEITVEPNETLLETLRNKLDIKSVKAACWQGDCGLCTVLLDGKPMKSCLILASEADNKEITTIEGLSKDALLPNLQESFLKHGAVQCGFCTSAFLLMGHYLISTNTSLTKSEIKHSLSGIICRCTGYDQIVDSIYAVHQNENGK